MTTINIHREVKESIAPMKQEQRKILRKWTYISENNNKDGKGDKEEITRKIEQIEMGKCKKK